MKVSRGEHSAIYTTNGLLTFVNCTTPGRAMNELLSEMEHTIQRHSQPATVLTRARGYLKAGAQQTLVPRYRSKIVRLRADFQVASNLYH